MRHFALSTILAACLVGSAAASPVAFTASGTFTGAEGSLNPHLIGQSFRFDIAYDTDSPEAGSYSYGSTQVAYYDLTSFVATIGGTSYNLDFFPQITVTADESSSLYSFAGAVYPTGTYEGMLFNLDFEPSNPLSDTSVPTSIADFGTSTQAQYRAIEGFGEFFTAGRAFASGASVQAVPEPTSLAALGLGALGLIRRRLTR